MRKVTTDSLMAWLQWKIKKWKQVKH